MFTRPEIAAAMNSFVLVELYTDGTDAESEANQQVQLAKFHTVAIPYYAILDPDEKVLAEFPNSTSNAAEYLAFLNKPAQPQRLRAATAPAPTATAAVYPQATKLDGGAIDTASVQRQGAGGELLGDMVRPLHQAKFRASISCIRTACRCWALRWMRRDSNGCSRSSRSTRWITRWAWAASR